MKKILLVIMLVCLKQVNAQIISTVAGNETTGYSGDGAIATNAQLNNPRGLALDAFGNLYIADFVNHRVRKVNSLGVISTVAGTGVAGSSGDGGQATNAKLNLPTALTFDALGNLYIADNSGNRIRKVNTVGIISTIAGDGVQGYSGDGGLAINAKLNNPYDIIFDASGNLYITDATNARVRKVNTAGIITTIAGNGIAGYSGDGGSANAAKLNFPYGLAFDALGNLYISDWPSRIRKINTLGIINTIGGNGIAGFNGDGGQATAAELNNPCGLAFDAKGNLYICDDYNTRVRMIDTAGIITTVVGNGTPGHTGDGGLADTAEVSYPTYIVFDVTKCNYYISEEGSNLSEIRKINLYPSLSLASNTYTICNKNSQALSVSGASSYLWSPSSTLNNFNASNPIASPSTTTVYSVTGANYSGCSNTTTLTVTVNDLPIVSVNTASICIGNTATLTASGASNYIWSTNDTGTTIIVSPDFNTKYIVKGTDINGCTNVDTVTQLTIDCPSIMIIPNIITPNGDNINDEFFIRGNYLNNFACKIYNRWGLLLYQWSDITSSWNAKDKNGVLYDDGTYYYLVSYTDKVNKPFTKNGFFQLLK